MANPERAFDLRTELEEAIVDPLFKKLKPATPADGSLPEIVLRHRVRRAHDRILDALVSRGSIDIPADLRKELQDLVRKWVATSFQDAFQAAEDFEVRCAREHDLVIAQESGDPEYLLDILEKDYRRRVIEQFGRIELRGIQTTHRVLLDLDHVYVPLHLEPQPEIEAEDGKIITLHARSRVEAPEVLQEHRQILVVGSPGSGKSTLVGYLATRAAAGQDNVLPLVLTVRSLAKESLTISQISQHTGCDSSLVKRSLERQNAFLLVDGLDEAPQEARARLVLALERFLRRYPGIRVLATSRPAGSPGEVEKSLPGLRPFRLADLSREEVGHFIDKWCLAAETSVRKEHHEAAKEAQKAAEDLKQRLSRSYSVQRIAVNPLLVSILCVVHRFLGRTIPEHRVTLYEKCTDALLYEWDRAKFPEGSEIGQLDASSKRRLLMGIARKVHDEHAAEIPESEVAQHFAAILPDLGRPAGDARAMIEQIRDRSGLLVERRPGFFGFSHLTFQEYLCALEYVRTRSFDELVDHYEEPWWHEVIVLAAGTPGAGNGTISRRLLSKSKPEAVFLAAQCLETEIDMPLKIRERIEKALQRMVPPRSIRNFIRLETLGIVAAPALVKSLFTHPEARLTALVILANLDFDPMIPAIAQCTGDPSASTALLGNSTLTVGGFATHVLADKSLQSEIARIALRDASLSTPLEDLKRLSVFYRELGPEYSGTAKTLEEALQARQRT